jgi:predicted metal-binding membrane protein
MPSVERRIAFATFTLLIAWAAIAWALTVRSAAEMSGMMLGLGQLGTRMPMAMSAPVFGGMWITMMVAMMFPTMVPMVIAHRMVTSRRREGWTSTFTFIAGYLVVWTVFGAVPFAVLVVLGRLPFEGGAARVAPLAGAVFALAGAYQFTPLKTVCLRACRTPIGFILSHDFRRGARGAFAAGIAHGTLCLGCCWALMAILLVLGLMNVAWMAALSAVFLLEKNWSRGVALSRLVGLGLAILGVAVVIRPELLVAFSGGRGSTPATDGMQMHVQRSREMIGSNRRSGTSQRIATSTYSASAAKGRTNETTTAKM